MDQLTKLLRCIWRGVGHGRGRCFVKTRSPYQSHSGIQRKLPKQPDSHPHSPEISADSHLPRAACLQPPLAKTLSKLRPSVESCSLDLGFWVSNNIAHKNGCGFKVRPQDLQVLVWSCESEPSYRYNCTLDHCRWMKLLCCNCCPVQTHPQI